MKGVYICTAFLLNRKEWISSLKVLKYDSVSMIYIIVRISKTIPEKVFYQFKLLNIINFFTTKSLILAQDER